MDSEYNTGEQQFGLGYELKKLHAEFKKSHIENDQNYDFKTSIRKLYDLHNKINHKEQCDVLNDVIEVIAEAFNESMPKKSLFSKVSTPVEILASSNQFTMNVVRKLEDRGIFPTRIIKF